jgi:histidine triad (HIT) family protein
MGGIMKGIFEKIIDREVHAEIVYEDDRVIAFEDINPVAPKHLLVVPKQRIRSLQEIETEDLPLLGHCLWVLRQLAEQSGVAQEGYRVVNNVGEYGGQTVEHLHFHLIGGRAMTWPPG